MKTKEKIHYKFTYVVDNFAEAVKESGIFIAVKIIMLFIQTYANNQLLTYSNYELLDKLSIKRMSSLHSAFYILEREGIIKRTFKDDKKRQRGPFEFDVEKAMLWMNTTIYDDMYKNAPKRSLIRAFVNQTLIVIKDIKERILVAVGKRRTKDRKDRIEKVVKKTNRLYDRYIKHLQKRQAKQEEINLQRVKSRRKKELLAVLDRVLLSVGYVPPDLKLN